MTSTPKQRVAAVVRRYQEGQTRRAIGLALRMKPETVKKILESQGFEFIPERRNKLTPAQEQEVIARYPLVQSSNALAEEYGCNHVTILNILKRAGVPRGKKGNPHRHLDTARVDEMVSLHEAGMSRVALAARFGIGPKLVTRALEARGIVSDHARGERHGKWQGGRVKVGNYIGVTVPDDSPYASMRWESGPYVLEHRLVMAEALGRPLTENETVHHINGDHTDNRLENLQLRFGRHGKGVAYRCADCGSRHIVADEIA